METNTHEKPGNAPQPCGVVNGYRTFFSNISYNCPSLKLFGYSTERSLANAIRRALKKSGKLV